MQSPDSLAPRTRKPRKAKVDVEARKLFLSRWFNEDALVNQRLTWLLVSQALLFAAYGTVATKMVDACQERSIDLSKTLQVITFVGPFLAAIVFFGIAAAVVAQFMLHREQEPRPPHFGVNTWTTIVGWITGLLVPVVFCVAWLKLPLLSASTYAKKCATEEAKTETVPLNQTRSSNAPSARPLPASSAASR